MTISQMSITLARLVCAQSNNIAHECDIGVNFAH
ncbi:hypothetical protein M2403_003472 [Rahnella sp. BIGb0603]|nr:hypothetical protein [Rahnella sp. BIGb0603]